MGHLDLETLNALLALHTAMTANLTILVAVQASLVTIAANTSGP